MKKILVIEDEGPLREEIVDTLGFEGFDVVQASDGGAGLQMAKTEQPDLIISDIMMPRVDGYELLRALRADTITVSIPLIFLTARADRSDMRQGMSLGADDYLTKPFTHEELVNAVAARLQRQTDVMPASAQELEQAKRTLLQMVSHELRTPLVSMTMVQDIIEMQMDHLEPAKLRDLLETLHHGSHRLRHLVEQIVFLTQFESGSIQQEIREKGSPAELWAVLTGAISLARDFVYRNREGSIRLDDQGQESLIYCHLPALKHALAELIANALSVTPEGQEILVSRWLADNWAYIRIVDPGCGMSPDQIKLALRDFHQINREQHEQQGLGLGLPLAHRIVDTHGGALRLKSMVGKGTQIDVALPIYRTDVK